MRRRMSLSLSAGLLLVFSLSIAGVSASEGTLVIGDGPGGDAEVAAAWQGSVTWSGTAWPEPTSFAASVFCTDVEFQSTGDSGFDRRMAIEFPLAELPPGATITAANLTLFDALSDPGDLLIRGYAGNGTVESTDVAVGGSALTFSPSPLVEETFNVTSLMTASMVTADWAGFALTNDFDRSVHGADGYHGSHRIICPNSATNFPVLTVQYTAPDWTYIGTGPQVTSTGRTASVPFPAGVRANDVLLMGCQGRHNSMHWTASGFAPQFNTQNQPAFGPGGLRFLLLGSTVYGDNPTPVTVSNTIGTNGWSCSISAFRRAVPGIVGIERQFTTGKAKAMNAPEMGSLAAADELATHWCASADDNNHGQSSHGLLAFGGTAHDTTVGTDHAASMSYHVGPGPGISGVVMRQRSNGPDAYVCMTFVIDGSIPEPGG